MARREAVGLTLAPAVLAAIWWLPAWFFLTVFALVILLAADEMLRMARTSGLSCGRAAPLAATAVTLAGAWLFGAVGLAAAVAATVIVLPTWRLAARRPPAGALAGAAVGSFTALYLGVTGACLGWLRILPGDEVGPRLVILFLVTIWVGDSGAYDVGRRLGRHRMAPVVSPNKTWEGLAGGTVATAAATFALVRVLGLELTWPHVAALAVILAVAAPLGDLLESLFKRDTGVKDSSALLPGHGGLLDRTDSLVFAAPPVLAYAWVAGLLG